MENTLVKVRQVGGSLIITLPVATLRKTSIREGDMVQVSNDGNDIRLTKVRLSADGNNKESQKQ